MQLDKIIKHISDNSDSIAMVYESRFTIGFNDPTILFSMYQIEQSNMYVVILYDITKNEQSTFIYNTVDCTLTMNSGVEIKVNHTQEEWFNFILVHPEFAITSDEVKLAGNFIRTKLINIYNDLYKPT